jgi:hypothetical protein
MRRQAATCVAAAAGGIIEEGGASMRSVCVAFLGLVLASSARANMPEKQPGLYQCNTAAGKFLQQEIVPLQRGQEMRLAFRLVEEHFSEQWTVLAAVYFIGPKGKSRIAVGKAQNDRSKMYVSVSTAGNQAQDVIFQYPVTNDWIPLNLTLDSYGFLTLQSGKLRKRYQWGPVSRTYLHCNSGDWEISVSPQSYLPPAAATPAPEVK